MMSLHGKTLYSLFGEPLREDIGTTMDGHRVYDEINPGNPTLILTLILSALLFTIYMWFYLSPLFREPPSYRSSTTTNPRQRRVVSRPRHNIRIIDPELNLSESNLQDEKKSLISWIHRSSLGRFIDVTGRIHHNGRVKVKHGPSSTTFGIRPLGLEDYRIFDLPETAKTKPLTAAPPPPSLPLPLPRNDIESPLISASMLTPPPPAYAPRSESSSQFELKRHLQQPSPPPSPLQTLGWDDGVILSTSTHPKFPHLVLSSSRSLSPPSPPRRSYSKIPTVD